MGRIARTAPPKMSGPARLAWLESRLIEVDKDIRAARKTNFAAVMSGQRLAMDLRAQIDTERLQLAEAEAEASRRGPEDMSPEEWAARVREDAGAASDGDLEVYAAELFRRRGYLLALGGGELSLRRMTG